MKRSTTVFAFAAMLLLAAIDVIHAQASAELIPNQPVKFTVRDKQSHEYSIELNVDEVCNITTDAPDDLPVIMSMSGPDGKALLKEGEPSQGYIFIADMAGKYVLTFSVAPDYPNDVFAKYLGTQVTVRYSNRFRLPISAKTKVTKLVNGYQLRIADEPAEQGSTFFTVQKAGKLKALMRAEKQITGGFYFSDDPGQMDGANARRSATLMRTTVDKTGDGTPDVAVEYYTGGAHCCFEITFFELGQTVRQLPTIDTANDRMTAIAKRPEGGLRYEFAEQAFAYWNINFAQSPMPTVIYEFNRSDDLVPRFDLMKKPAPTQTRLKRDAAVMRGKINLNPYTSPEDNFNDWEEPFWAEMLDLMYTGHEDLAWQYFDLVWPARKKGKEKFLSDFKEQLAFTAYGEWKKSHL